jgi:hypothetical protein
MPGDISCCAAPSFNAGSAPAISWQAARLVIFIVMDFVPPVDHAQIAIQLFKMCATLSRGKKAAQSGLFMRSSRLVNVR